jgi:hypothetical protein
MTTITGPIDIASVFGPQVLNILVALVTPAFISNNGSVEFPNGALGADIFDIDTRVGPLTATPGNLGLQSRFITILRRKRWYFLPSHMMMSLNTFVVQS